MTPRPGRIARVIEVDLPRPRTLDMEFSQEFKEYTGEIRQVIFAGKKG
jgi:NitT/TauT family transport system ATP-binding protein